MTTPQHQYHGNASNTASPASTATVGGQLPSFDRFTADAIHGGRPSVLPLQELELLHNFVTQTAATLNPDTLVQMLIRTHMPQLGLKYEFLMRGLLAFSALHLAHYRLEQYDYYIAQAVHHYEAGLREASSLIPNINEENCTSLYLFSILTFQYNLAKPRKPDDFFLTSEHGSADWLFLIKGSQHILQATYPSLLKGPFGALFKRGALRVSRRDEAAEAGHALLSQPQSAYDHLRELLDMIKTEVRDPAQIVTYTEAIETLQKTFIMTEAASGFETGDVFVWVYRTSDAFLDLVREHRPEALCILAYFSVLLRMLEHFWWVQGWPVHLLSRIYNVLDGSHRLWIQWPIEQVGWIPT